MRNALAASVLLASSLIGAEPPVRLLQITDTHMACFDGVPVLEVIQKLAPKGLINCGERLSEALVRAKKELNPDFAVITGDMIVAYAYQFTPAIRVDGQVERFARLAAASPVKLFLSLGNHDLVAYRARPEGGFSDDQSVAGAARAAWIRSVECFREGTWYAFERKVGQTSYRVIALDNAYYGGRLTDSGQGAGREYRLSHEQLYWLKKEVEANPESVLILLAHVPLGKDAMTESIRSVIGARKRRAIVLTGHNHVPDHVETVEAPGQPPLDQVRTPAFMINDKFLRLIELHEDRVEIFPTGKTAEPTVLRVEK